MWIFSILLIFILAVYFMNRYETEFYEAVPLSLCSVLLLMYGLCFFRGLWLIDFIGFFAVAASFGKMLAGRRELQEGKVTVRMPERAEVLGIVLMLALLLFCTSYKTVSWWDDINFWAADAKFYYYYGGFAPKYGNVAPEFGDYPPLLSLVKWLFLHCQRAEFREGLMFAAYYSFHVILLLPLLAHGKRKHPVFSILAVPFLFLIPGIVDFVYVEGTCADVTMGILYGNFLWAVWQDQKKKKEYYLLRIAVYGSALVLCKSVGIEWMIFGAVFCLILKRIRKNQEGILSLVSWRTCIGTLLIPVLVEGSWLLFCLVNRRVAKLTGAGVRIAVSGNFSFLERAAHKGMIFVKGFLKYPMHANRGIGWDISSGCFFLLLLTAAVFLWKKRAVAKKEGGFLFFYLLVTAVLAYGIIFLGHITIFAAEAQYEDPAVMAMSVARYGAPFALGTFFLLWNIWLSGRADKRGMAAYVPLLLCVLLLTNLSDAAEALSSGRDFSKKEQEMEKREAMMETSGMTYVEKGKNYPELKGKRVLYLREDSSIHWVKDAYISYESSPVATVYAGIDTSSMNGEDMIDRLNSSHASYLYCDDVKGSPAVLFQGMMEKGEFQEETFYKIKRAGDQIRLVKMKG